MDSFRIEFADNGMDEVSSHEGEELISCIAGEVGLTYGGEKTILRTGDTAYYNTVVKHGLRALNGRSAQSTAWCSCRFNGGGGKWFCDVRARAERPQDFDKLRTQ